MYEPQHQALGMELAVDQLRLSLRAAKSVELQQAVHERKLERKAQRQQRRDLRRGRGTYAATV